MSWGKFEKALAFAALHHTGQRGKKGAPHMLHVLAVVNRVAHLGPLYATAAALHDVVEDTGATQAEVFAGFGERVAGAVDALTHHPGEPYRDYVTRCAQDPVARAVKLADLDHNITRSSMDPSFDSLLKRWRKARAYLLEQS